MKKIDIHIIHPVWGLTYEMNEISNILVGKHDYKYVGAWF
jgi:hypothetical protein